MAVDRIRKWLARCLLAACILSPEIDLSSFESQPGTLQRSTTPRRSTARSERSGSLPRQNEITREVLLAAARNGGDYLVRMQETGGRFSYWYDPATDSVDTSQYNILRHAGTALSLLDLYEVTRDARYLKASQAAVTYLKTRFRAVNAQAMAVAGRRTHAAMPVSSYVLDFDGKAKLGANGLALIVLTRQMHLDPQSADSTSATRLAELILRLQRADGGFESYYRLRGDEPAGDVSLYYPGEAMLGLLGLYEANGDPRLLQSARRGAEYVIDSRRRMKQLPPDAWLMQSLENLYNREDEKSIESSRRKQKYLEHLFALANAITRDQYGNDAPAGYAGAFRPGVARSTPAASRSEGLLAAYRIAVRAGDSRAEMILTSLKASARFQLSQQFDVHNRSLVANRDRARGGFRESLTSMRIRIDFVQHNVCSLLQLARLI